MTNAQAPTARSAERPTQRDLGLILALVTLEVAISLSLSQTGVRFDGFLDVHRYRVEPVPIGVALLDQAAALIAAITVAVALVRLWRPQARASAVALVVSVARLPLVLFAPAVLVMPLPDTFAAMSMSTVSAPSPLIIVFGLAAVAVAVGVIALLASGLRRVTGAREWSLAAFTLLVLVMAEVASKLVLAAAT